MQFTDAVCDSSPVTLEEALESAEGTAEDDVIHIGPVTIAEDMDGPFGAGFNYTPADAGNDLTLIGRGADETTIQRSDDREFGTFTTSLNSHVTLQDLEIHVIGNTMLDSSQSTGLRVREGGATLTRVRVTAEAGAFNHAPGSGVRLVLASGPMTLTDSEIYAADNTSAECLTSTADMTPVITGSVFSDCDFGVLATATSVPSIDRSTFTSGGRDVRIVDGAGVNINRTIFLGDASSLVALDFLSGEDFRLDNSLIVREADTGAVNVAPATDGDDASGAINQSTLINTFPSPAGSVGVNVTRGNVMRNASVAIHDSIILGFFNSAFRFGTLTSDYSFYDFATSDHPAGTGDIDSLDDTVDPGFANPPVDYSPASGSILRDVDPNVAARPGEVFTTDLALTPRIDNGARDIGAYESTFVPAVTPPPPPDQPALTGQRAKALKKCKKVKKKKARKKCLRKAQKLPL